MSKKEMTLVYYYVPEDGDDPETPNVFGASFSKNNIRLQNIYDTFPLKGSYIFRFKVMYDNVVAWLDLPELDTKLPTFKDRIIIKATRISWESNHNNPYGHYRFAKQAQKSEVPAKKPEKPVKEAVPAPAKKEANYDLLGEKIESVSESPSDDLI